MTVKKLSLRPYPGQVRVCKTQKAYQREYQKLFGGVDAYLTETNKGRMTGKVGDGMKSPRYLVWASSTTYLAHELSHVILHVFEVVGIDPRAADGEPFCYMLSQLLLECEE